MLRVGDVSVSGIEELIKELDKLADRESYGRVEIVTNGYGARVFSESLRAMIKAIESKDKKIKKLKEKIQLSGDAE